MKQVEIKDLINRFTNKKYLADLAGKSAAEIDAATLEIMSVTDELKCCYHLLKGRICEILKSDDDLEAMLRSVHGLVGSQDELRHHDLVSTVELESETADEALEVVRDEIAKLKGMRTILSEYAEGVAQFCEIWLKTVFGADYDVMALPDPMVGRRNEDGTWDEDACRQSFVGIMLYLMDEYDVKSVPFRAVGAIADPRVDEAQFPGVTINRLALVECLKGLYSIDDDTANRISSDNAFFVQVARAFVSETEKTLTQRGKVVFFARHGLETGVAQTLAELADKYGVTREYLRQLIDKETRKLKHPLHRERILCLQDED